MEIASKLSFQHLASLSRDQMTSKVIKLYVCRCEGAMALLSAPLREGCESALICLFFFLCRKGQQLEPSEKYMFNRMEGGRSMLTIRNIRQSDGGSYACKANNKAGSQERELFLKVFGKDDGKCWNEALWGEWFSEKQHWLLGLGRFLFLFLGNTWNYFLNSMVRMCVFLFFTLASLCWQPSLFYSCITVSSSPASLGKDSMTAWTVPQKRAAQLVFSHKLGLHCLLIFLKYSSKRLLITWRVLAVFTSVNVSLWA